MENINPGMTMAVREKVSFSDKFKAILQLTRWRQHVPYTLPAVLGGALLAAELNPAVTLDWRVLTVTVANVLAMAFAFMINDVVDAPDDAKDPNKHSNVIAAGIFSVHEGNFLAGLLFAVSAFFYFFGGWYSFGAGMLTLMLSYLYSARPFRLKARPIVDVLSHVLMLSGLLMLSSYVIYEPMPRQAWFMLIAITFASAYGQFYNQVEDFEADRAAGLQNTASFLGKNGTKIALYASAAIGVISFCIAVYLKSFPLWLGPIMLVTIFILSLFRWDYDMRGNVTEASGMIQQPFLILANILSFVWLLGELGWLRIP
jgi:4-hydroxybenzoate polyprenyltransferase